jgi:hypothetical protein
MYLNAIRIRAALMVAGVLVTAMFFAFGGKFGPQPVVQIEFGMYPEVFQGLTVEIDGKPAGRLQMMGAANRTGFIVKEGTHTVRVVHPLYSSVERSVDVRANGRPVLLILDLQANAVASSGQLATVIGWQN